MLIAQDKQHKVVRKMYSPLDGNNITTFISIKRCLNFWSRSRLTMHGHDVSSYMVVQGM